MDGGLPPIFRTSSSVPPPPCTVPACKRSFWRANVRLSRAFRRLRHAGFFPGRPGCRESLRFRPFHIDAGRDGQLGENRPFPWGKPPHWTRGIFRFLFRFVLDFSTVWADRSTIVLSNGTGSGGGILHFTGNSLSGGAGHLALEGWQDGHDQLLSTMTSAGNPGFPGSTSWATMMKWGLRLPRGEMRMNCAPPP